MRIATSENVNGKMLVGSEITLARADQQRRPRIYDATELVAMDTAYIRGGSGNLHSGLSGVSA